MQLKDIIKLIAIVTLSYALCRAENPNPPWVKFKFEKANTTGVKIDQKDWEWILSDTTEMDIFLNKKRLKITSKTADVWLKFYKYRESDLTIGLHHVVYNFVTYQFKTLSERLYDYDTGEVKSDDTFVNPAWTDIPPNTTSEYIIEWLKKRKAPKK